MAQLKEDEWPADGESTTAEEEGSSFKREGENPPPVTSIATDGPCGTKAGGANRAPMSRDTNEPIRSRRP